MGWGFHPLHARRELPGRGVACRYLIADADGVVLYVGATEHLRARLRPHRLRYPEGATVDWFAFEDRAAAEADEALLIARWRPRDNRIVGHGRYVAGQKQAALR
jgi:excinuclease UvrABC nuclease subunit